VTAPPAAANQARHRLTAMRLKVLLPTRALVETEVVKVVAEAPSGSFCLLPRHIDFVSALAPGVLAYVDAAATERFVATDEGLLLKCREEVTVCTRKAVLGDDLASLREAVQVQFLKLDEHERAARSALARLEAGIVRRFLEFKESA